MAVSPSLGRGVREKVDIHLTAGFDIGGTPHQKGLRIVAEIGVLGQLATDLVDIGAVISVLEQFENLGLPAPIAVACISAQRSPSSISPGISRIVGPSLSIVPPLPIATVTRNAGVASVSSEQTPQGKEQADLRRPSSLRRLPTGNGPRTIRRPRLKRWIRRNKTDDTKRRHAPSPLRRPVRPNR